MEHVGAQDVERGLILGAALGHDGRGRLAQAVGPAAVQALRRLGQWAARRLGPGDGDDEDGIADGRPPENLPAT